MIKKVKCIMLIDDNSDDNFFHERVIRKNDAAEIVVSERSAETALAYLKQSEGNKPDLIFLDINMPKMNGWEFLKEYNKLDKTLQGRAVVVMLTTSENPDDRLRASNVTVDFRTKPLTKEMLEELTNKYG